jgi:hypothetical protein
VFFKVVQQREDGDADFAWTAPVWFDGGGAQPVHAPALGPDASGFVASVNWTVCHVSNNCKDVLTMKPENRTGAATKVDGANMKVLPDVKTNALGMRLLVTSMRRTDRDSRTTISPSDPVC